MKSWAWLNVLSTRAVSLEPRKGEENQTKLVTDIHLQKETKVSVFSVISSLEKCQHVRASEQTENSNNAHEIDAIETQAQIHPFAERGCLR